MGPSGYIALIVIVVGALIGAGGLLFAGLLMGLVLALRSLWSRYGLRSLEYERHLSADRVLWGERLDLDLIVRNGKPLPLPWLRIDDLVTHGAEIVGAGAAALGDRRVRRAARDVEHRLVRARHAASPDRRHAPGDATGSSRPSCASPTCSRARIGSRSARSPRPIAWCLGS